MGVLQLTRDNVAAVGPRWAPNGHDIYYTSFLHGYPAIYRINQTGGYRKALAPFRGLNTGADISPDGSRAALILSVAAAAYLRAFAVQHADVPFVNPDRSPELVF